jgi:hypothetical protein
MFEIIVTYRPDFREEVLERCAGLEEAQAIAARLATTDPQRFVRIWIRRVLRTAAPGAGIAP